MHSEHISKERSDAQNVVSRFPCGMHNPSTQPAAEPRPFFIICGVSRHHHPLNLLNPLNPLNLHTEGVSNGEAGKGEASAASQ